MKRMLKVVALIGIMAMLSIALFGCGGQDAQENEGQENGTEQQEAKGTIKLGYVEWESEVASTNVLAEVLKQEGYDVEMTGVDAGVLWTGVAEGDIDGMCSAWLPATQKNYWDKFQGDVVNLGPSIKHCKIGLVVPKYVEIDSIAELNDVKDKFDGKITGIESGAGVMQNTEEAIEEYGLDLSLQASSSAAMAASLKRAIDNDEWEVVTGWTPHWKFAKFDLKYLKDPKNVYGDEEHVSTIVRQGFKEDFPEAAQIMDNFFWEPKHMQQVMLEVHDGMKPTKAAQNWIENHQDLVSEWTSVE
ncbi:MAG: glycine betaine ABC transporter substrate-binding protein [Clostridiales bacterium]|nr:glycine betaine ABC transporter substrate-binding protein [Clostridiales bacterium]MCF8022559.1 glycine betaine ABC transporter substrate-binding protein [Clostridiales bacterium]